MSRIISSLFIIYTIIIEYGYSDIDVCPFLMEGTPATHSAEVPVLDEYNELLKDLDISEVFNDIYSLLSDSQTCWPSDTINGESSYIGLFIRLAWHCAGTFRLTDNGGSIGGCAGGRQRFPPESSMDDNTNLDKARALLVPIKNKYGDALSWGDLMVFAGTASIIAAGGPVTEVCAGRIDESDGTNSNSLGTSPQQLLYVNPEGVNGNPDPLQSAERIRNIFGNMGFNDIETVALIGGGHAFGKCHGSCTLGAGDGPLQQPFNPWPGKCGTGKGDDTFTSGLEGRWTTFPFKWDNEFFCQLIDDEYVLLNGPGGKHQWENKRNGNLMLTTDLAFIYDDIYYDITYQFANDLDSLNIAFGAVWEKLTTNGGGFALNKKCIDGQELISAFVNKENSYYTFIISHSTSIIICIFIVLNIMICCNAKNKYNITQKHRYKTVKFESDSEFVDSEANVKS